MTSEDKVAAKLIGHNCFIKFLDGEELFIDVENITDGEEDASEWFLEVEQFLNGTMEYFPYPNIAIARNSVKYVKRI